MLKKNILWMVLGVSLAALPGCATTQSQPVDADALRSKIAALEGQLAEKDAELARLQNQMRDEESARTQAEGEKKMLSEKLDAALSRLEKSRAQAPSAAESDLK